MRSNYCDWTVYDAAGDRFANLGFRVSRPSKNVSGSQLGASDLHRSIIIPARDRIRDHTEGLTAHTRSPTDMLTIF